MSEIALNVTALRSTAHRIHPEGEATATAVTTSCVRPRSSWRNWKAIFLCAGFP
ncbi:MAG: hypothetical protein NZM04_05715 [Methylacidiphilales bacterium]|nr:hypothetical protein [Candidatus Methylacidiphilales bacterium]MDW8349524.1 hypothetical protein [Verrucomicrobiae bacterium]